MDILKKKTSITGDANNWGIDSLDANMDEVNTREYEEYIDKQVIVLLTDNRFLYGTLKSYDQYNSISLNFVTERIFLGDRYAENRLGLIAIRGENIAFIAKANYDFSKLQKVRYDLLYEEISKM